MQELVADPDATPSARIIAELRDADCGFFTFALAMAHSHKTYFDSIAEPNDAVEAEYHEEAIDSLKRQAEIEAQDSMSLDEYLANYFR